MSPSSLELSKVEEFWSIAVKVAEYPFGGTISVCVCVRTCVRACVRACVRPCERACVRPCERASVRACVRASVRACARARERGYVGVSDVFET